MSGPDIIEFITDPQLLGLTVSPAQETFYGGSMACRSPRTTISTCDASARDGTAIRTTRLGR